MTTKDIVFAAYAIFALAFAITALVIVGRLRGMLLASIEECRTLQQRYGLKPHPDDHEIGDSIKAISEILAFQGGKETCHIQRCYLQRWHDAFVHAGARLDPDNQPLTFDDLKRMKFRRPRTDTDYPLET